MSDRQFQERLLELLEERNCLARENNEIMNALDADVQAATAVINDLVAALAAAGSGVSADDQTALETAITAGQTAVPAPAAPAEPVVTSPEVS